MQQRLQQILEGCLDNPAASSKALRELLDTDLARFSAACLPTLQSRLETPGGQFLVGLLAARNLLVEPLRHPSFFSREEAIAVAQLGAVRSAAGRKAGPPGAGTDRSGR